MAKKGKKPKKVSYQLIDPTSDTGKPMYRLLNTLVKKHHAELTNARIALAWNTAWKRDKDGRLTLGKCRKASDLDRELAAFDFVILLLRWFYQDETVTDQQRTALVDHELCHAQVQADVFGEPERDERGRIVYRLRKHDLEEFAEVAERYGCYKSDLEEFAQALRRSKQAQLPLEQPAEALRGRYPTPAV
jgi:hypothetical protein